VEQGLRALRRYMECLGRFPDTHTAFIATMYGAGELPQAFARCCAVYGGAYVLRRSAARLLVGTRPASMVRAIRLISQAVALPRPSPPPPVRPLAHSINVVSPTTTRLCFSRTSQLSGAPRNVHWGGVVQAACAPRGALAEVDSCTSARAELEELLRQHAPQRLAQLEQLLMDWAGKEAELLAQCRAQYLLPEVRFRQLSAGVCVS
jgi:hypothetical protein